MKSNRCIPASSVIPEVAYGDVVAGAAWLAQAFGFQIRLRIANHRIQMMLGSSALVVTERRGDDTRRSCIMLRIDDADDVCRRAVAAGGAIVRPPEDYPHGERQAHVEDPEGNRWTLSQTIADIDPTGLGFEPGPAFD